jgi:hypothetical protein
MYTPLLLALLSCAFATPVIKYQGSNAIAGKWIVKLKGDVTSLAENDLKASISIKPDFDYSMVGFRGFAGTLSDEELSRLQASDHVRTGLWTEKTDPDLYRSSTSSRMPESMCSKLCKRTTLRGAWRAYLTLSRAVQHMRTTPALERVLVRTSLMPSISTELSHTVNIDTLSTPVFKSTIPSSKDVRIRFQAQ